MLVPFRRVARKRGEEPEVRSGPPDQANERLSGADSGIYAPPHDRSRRPDGRRQDQDRASPVGTPQFAVLRFGYRDRFFDSDTEIEAAAGETIEEIFRNRGEAVFRDGERRVIARLLGQPVHVLATGGGAFMDPATRALIIRRGVSVWLRADLDVLLARVARRNNRPLLRRQDPRTVLAELIERRHPIYAEADVTIDSGEGPLELTTTRVIAALAGSEPALRPPESESEE